MPKRQSKSSKKNTSNTEFSFGYFALFPTDIQNLILAYLDNETLLAYAVTSKEKLKQTQPELKRRLQKLSLLKIIPAESATFLLADNKVYACGVNNGGKLGFGDDEIRKVFEQIPGIEGTIQNVITGEEHIIILTDQGLYGCGASRQGQLGIHDKQYVERELFEKLPAVPGNIQQIVAGENHTVILTDQGLYGCGSNSRGQLGFGDTSKIKSFTKLSQMMGNVQQIAAGRDYTLILTDQGLYGSGYNGWGQLGLGNINSIKQFKQLTNVPSNIQQVMAAGDNTFILADTGLYATGRNAWGQFGLGDEKIREKFTQINDLPGTIQQLIVADEHTMLLTDEGLLYTCGNNEGGRLGLGDTKNRNKFTQVEKVAGTIQQILASRFLSFIWTEKGLYATGNNSWVQLPWKKSMLEFRQEEKGIASTLSFKPVKNVPKTVKICWEKYQQFVRLIKSNSVFEQKGLTLFSANNPERVTLLTSQVTVDLNNQQQQKRHKID